MSNIRNIVKVMNFHSLLRIDSSRKKAEKYFSAEKELTKMISYINSNKNLMLDKKSIIPDKKLPVLKVYIGSDYGFCGDFNNLINQQIRKDKNVYKIIVGNKMTKNADNILLEMSKEEFNSKIDEIEKIIYDSIKPIKYSKITLIYIHYNNINDLQFQAKEIFPISLDFNNDNGELYNEDFTIETNVNDVMSQLISLYLCYEIRICGMNSCASENVMRQRITNDSLKKIDELQKERKKIEKKFERRKRFNKIIDSFKTLKEVSK